MANWPAIRPTLTTGCCAPNVSTTAIWRKARKKSRILSAPCSRKLSAQSPPCSRKPFPPQHWQAISSGDALHLQKPMAERLQAGLRSPSAHPHPMIIRNLLDRFLPHVLGVQVSAIVFRPCWLRSASSHLVLKLAAYNPLQPTCIEPNGTSSRSLRSAFRSSSQGKSGQSTRACGPLIPERAPKQPPKATHCRLVFVALSKYQRNYFTNI